MKVHLDLFSPPPPYMSYNGIVDVANQWMPTILLNPSCVNAESVTQKRNATIIWLSQAYFVNAPNLSVAGENKDNICRSNNKSHVQVLRSSREPCGDGCIGLWCLGKATWYCSLAARTEDGEKGGITVWIIRWWWGSTAYTSSKSCGPLQDYESPTQSIVTQPYSCEIFWWHCIWMQCIFVLSYWRRLHFEYRTYFIGWEGCLQSRWWCGCLFLFSNTGCCCSNATRWFLIVQLTNTSLHLHQMLCRW